VSSTSMNVASMTEMAISQGLGAGRLRVRPCDPATVVLAIHSPQPEMPALQHHPVKRIEMRHPRQTIRRAVAKQASGLDPRSR